MQELEGISAKDLIEAVQQNDQARLSIWAPMKIEPERVSLLLFRSMLEQFFNHGMFNADPHAANILVLNDGRLGLVDFGMVGTLDERVRLQQFRLRQSIARGDAYAAFQVMLDSIEPVPDVDLTQFEAEFKQLVGDWINAVKSSTSSLRQRSSGYFIRQLFDSMRRAHISVPLSVVQMYRAMMISDAVMLAICPHVDWIPELNRFVNDERRRRSELLWKNLISTDFLQSLGAISLLAVPALENGLIWLNYRLPKVARDYRESLGRIERVFLIFLSYARTVLWLVVFGIAGGEWLAPRWWPKGAWATAMNRVRPWQWWVFAIALVGAFMLGTATRNLREES